MAEVRMHKIKNYAWVMNSIDINDTAKGIKYTEESAYGKISQLMDAIKTAKNDREAEEAAKEVADLMDFIREEERE